MVSTYHISTASLLISTELAEFVLLHKLPYIISSREDAAMQDAADVSCYSDEKGAEINRPYQVGARGIEQLICGNLHVYRLCTDGA